MFNFFSPFRALGARASLVVDTFNEGRPAVTHIFHGRTRAEAESNYRAHCQQDPFLMACTRGQLPNCSFKARWEEA
jgi:hypothetical protein